MLRKIQHKTRIIGKAINTLEDGEHCVCKSSTVHLCQCLLFNHFTSMLLCKYVRFTDPHTDPRYFTGAFFLLFPIMPQ